MRYMHYGINLRPKQEAIAKITGIQNHLKGLLLLSKLLP